MRIKELRTQSEMSQQRLADKIGVSRSTLAMWETNKSQPDLETICRIADLFGVTSDYVLGRNGASKNTSKGIQIPVLGRVVAGIPVEAVEEILEFEEITPEMAAQGEHFALQIKGDSMEPRMLAGDVVIVRKQSDVDNGDTAVVLVNGNEATIKKIKKSDDGIMLIPTNPNYEVMFYSLEQIKTLPVSIIGKVVELRGKY